MVRPLRLERRLPRPPAACVDQLRYGLIITMVAPGGNDPPSSAFQADANPSQLESRFCYSYEQGERYWIRTSVCLSTRSFADSCIQPLCQSLFLLIRCCLLSALLFVFQGARRSVVLSFCLALALRRVVLLAVRSVLLVLPFVFPFVFPFSLGEPSVLAPRGPLCRPACLLGCLLARSTRRRGRLAVPSGLPPPPSR